MTIRKDPRPQLRMRLWECRGRTLADRLQLGARSRQRDSRGEARERLNGRRLLRASRCRDAKRCPELEVQRKDEITRHDADDGVLRVAELDHAAEDRRIAGKAAGPDLLADHRDGRRRRVLVAVLQISSANRIDPGDAKSSGTHFGDAYRLWCAAGPDEVADNRAIRTDVDERGRLLTPGGDIPSGGGQAAALHVLVVERDDAMAVRERHHRVANFVHQAVGACGDRNRGRHPVTATAERPGLRRNILTASLTSSQERPVRMRGIGFVNYADNMEQVPGSTRAGDAGRRPLYPAAADCGRTTVNVVRPG